MSHRFFTQHSLRARRLPAFAIVLAILPVLASFAAPSQHATYRIEQHLMSAGGSRLHNSCFVLNGTAGQGAPGYSSSADFALLGGFWPAVSTKAPSDQLTFSGFEGCAP